VNCVLRKGLQSSLHTCAMTGPSVVKHQHGPLGMHPHRTNIMTKRIYERMRMCSLRMEYMCSLRMKVCMRGDGNIHHFWLNRDGYSIVGRHYNCACIAIPWISLHEGSWRWMRHPR